VTARLDGPSRRLLFLTAVSMGRRDGCQKQPYHMQFHNSVQGLFRKYYAIDGVLYLCDAASSAIWDEQLQNGRKGWFTDNCHLPSASGQTSQKVADLLG